MGVKEFRQPPYFKSREGIGGIPAYIFPKFLV